MVSQRFSRGEWQSDFHWYWFMTSTSPVESYFGKGYHFPASNPWNQREEISERGWKKKKLDSTAEPHELWIVIMQKWPNCITVVTKPEAGKLLKTGILYHFSHSANIGGCVYKCADRLVSFTEIKIKAVIQSWSTWALGALAGIWRRQKRKYSSLFGLPYEQEINVGTILCKSRNPSVFIRQHQRDLIFRRRCHRWYFQPTDGTSVGN